MSNRKKIVRMYHVRFASDFLVPALSRQEALELAEDSMINLIEDEDCELGDLFAVTVESDKFHIVEIVDEDDEDEDGNDNDDDDNDDNDDNDDDDDEDGEEEDDEEGVDETEDDE